MFQGSPHRTRAGHRYYDYGPLCGAQEKDDETKLFLPVCCRCGFYTSRNILAIRGYVDPLPSVLAIILGILGIYFARMHIDEVIKDKRTQKITEITALRTLQISWVGLFLFALWMIIEALGEEFRHFNRYWVSLDFGFLVFFVELLSSTCSYLSITTKNTGRNKIEK